MGHATFEKWDVVRFKADKTLGVVIQPGVDKSLISYKPERASGATEAHDWFQNDELTFMRHRDK